MSAYLAGLVTLPTLWGLLWIANWATAQPIWVRRYCNLCSWVQERSDHPFRPWWVWNITSWWDHRRNETPEHYAKRTAWLREWGKP